MKRLLVGFALALALATSAAAQDYNAFSIKGTVQQCYSNLGQTYGCALTVNSPRGHAATQPFRVTCVGDASAAFPASCLSFNPGDCIEFDGYLTVAVASGYELFANATSGFKLPQYSCF